MLRSSKSSRSLCILSRCPSTRFLGGRTSCTTWKKRASVPGNCPVPSPESIVSHFWSRFSCETIHFFHFFISDRTFQMHCLCHQLQDTHLPQENPPNPKFFSPSGSGSKQVAQWSTEHEPKRRPIRFGRPIPGVSPGLTGCTLRPLGRVLRQPGQPGGGQACCGWHVGEAQGRVVGGYASIGADRLVGSP